MKLVWSEVLIRRPPPSTRDMGAIRRVVEAKRIRPHIDRAESRLLVGAAAIGFSVLSRC